MYLPSTDSISPGTSAPHGEAANYASQGLKGSLKKKYARPAIKQISLSPRWRNATVAPGYETRTLRFVSDVLRTHHAL